MKYKTTEQKSVQTNSSYTQLVQRSESAKYSEVISGSG